jgi:hypothetical protein
MAKRTAAKSATALVTAVDAANADSIAARNRKLAAVSAPTYDASVPLVKVYRDEDFNVRRVESYGIAANPALADSLDRYGIDPTKPPITLSLQTDGRFLALRGNIRLSIIEELNAKSLQANGVVRFDALPALVYQGLTRDEEILIMADHTGQRELDRYELACMIGRASLARKWTDKQGATYFGINPNTVQRLRMRYMMPRVLADLKTECVTPDNALIIGQTELTNLYKAYQVDISADNMPPRSEGRCFLAAWEDMLRARESADNPAPQNKPKTAKEIDTVLASVTTNDHPVLLALTAALRWAKGDPSVSLMGTFCELKDSWDALARRAGETVDTRSLDDMLASDETIDA